jgi:hypothetical protein
MRHDYTCLPRPPTAQARGSSVITTDQLMRRKSTGGSWIACHAIEASEQYQKFVNTSTAALRL